MRRTLGPTGAPYTAVTVLRRRRTALRRTPGAGKGNLNRRGDAAHGAPPLGLACAAAVVAVAGGPGDVPAALVNGRVVLAARAILRGTQGG